MTDKKPGFFKRLFGGDPVQPVPPAPQPVPPPELPTELPQELPPPVDPTPLPPEPVPPVPAPEPEPVPQREPEEIPPPGPPETTPDYLEDIEQAASAERDVVVAPPPAAPEAPRQGWFARLASGLKRSSDQLSGSITSVFTKRKLDAATLDELEDVLIQADLGIETASAITEALRRDRFDKDVTGEDVRAVLAAEVEKVLLPVARPLAIDPSQNPSSSS